jgi:hypothetical protein
MAEQEHTVYDMCKEIVQEIIDGAVDEAEETELMFMKGHLSPIETKILNTIVKSPEIDFSAFFSDQSDNSDDLINICHDQRSSEESSSSSETDSNELSTDVWSTCESHCELKNYLFSCIGEVDTLENDEKLDRYFHIGTDLLMAVGEVQKRIKSCMKENQN